MQRLRITLLCLVISAVLPLASAVSAQAGTAATAAAPATAHASISSYEPDRVTTSRIISNSTAAPDSTAFYKGYGTVCGGTASGDCQSWWVDLHFGFTLSSGGQAWVNGFTSAWCTAGGTNITWCGYTGNGTDHLSIGANFGNGGWVRLDVELRNVGAIAWTWDQTKVSWANWGGWCIKENSACY